MVSPSPAGPPFDPSSTEWFYACGRQRMGPVAWPELRRLAEEGAVSPTDMLCPMHDRRWRAAREIPGLFPIAVAQPVEAVVPLAQPVEAVVQPVDVGKTAADSSSTDPLILDALPVDAAEATAPVDGSIVEAIPLPDEDVVSAVPLPEGENVTGPPMSGSSTPALASAVASLGNAPAIPGFVILGELGRGGMGVVYKAIQTGLNRTVALKMILAGAHASAGLLKRFRQEAELLARLQHPNIVQIYEIAENNGLPYFSFEYLDGGSLAEQIRGEPQPPMTAAALMQALARAVDAAHRVGIVHRDLKPGNVLRTARGEVKITDFGLAKNVHQEGHTATGATLGTPSYMAPEQAVGAAGAVGPLCDVYALGAVLYELLTGRPPFKAATPMETMMQVASVEPVPPGLLQPKIPVELETICLKCLEKEPSRRYGSAGELAEELRRFQAGEPIRARPVGVGRRTLKWARRKPAVAGLVAVSLLALALLLGGGTLFTVELGKQIHRAERERDRVLDQEKLTQDQRDEAREQERQAQAERDNARREKERAEEALERSRRNLYTAQLWRAAALLENQSEGDRALELLDDSGVCTPGLRDVVWRIQRGRCRARPFKEPLTHLIAFSPDSRTLATVENKRVGLWDAVTRTERLHLGNVSVVPQAVVFSLDGKRCVACDGAANVYVWNTATGAAQEPMLDAGQRIAFGAEPHILATLKLGTKQVNLWDLDRQMKVETLAPPRIDGPYVLNQIASDGRTLAALDNSYKIHLFDLANKQWSHAVATDFGGISSQQLAFSPDGQWLAHAARKLRVWNVKTGELRLALPVSAEVVAFSADSQTLAAGVYRHRKDRIAATAAVRMWDLASAEERTSLPVRADARGLGEAGPPTGLAFSRDGRFAAAAATKVSINPGLMPHPLRLNLWETEDGPDFSLPRSERGGAESASITADGRTLATGCADGRIRLWSLPDGKALDEFPAHAGEITGIAISPDGKMIGSIAVEDRMVRLHERATHKERGSYRIGNADPNSGICFNPDSRTFLFHDSGSIMAWHVRDEAPAALLKPARMSHCFTYSPDGKLVAVGGGHVEFWDVVEKRSLQPLPLTAGTVVVVFGADRNTIATLTSDRSTVTVWDIAQKVARATLKTKGAQLVAFNGAASLVACGGLDGDVAVFDVATSATVAQLPAHGGPVQGLLFTPDGKYLITVGSGLVKFWNLARIQSQARRDKP